MEERAVCAEDRACAAARESRRHGDGVLLGDADIEVLAAERGAVFGAEIDAADNACGQIDEIRVLPCCFEHKIHGRSGVRVGRDRLFGDARLHMKGRMAVPALGIILGKGEPLALLRVDVNDDGAVTVLLLGEHADEFLRIVAVRNIAIGEPHRAEEIVLRRAVCLAQLFELAVHAAVVLGDGLIVVVEHDDEVRPHLADDVQPLERLAAGHGTVADHDDDIFLSARTVARLGES